MKTKKKANLGSLLRLLNFLWKNYKLSLIVSFILIVLSSLATVNVTASIQSLVDVYVEPMLTSNSQDFGPLLFFLMRVGLICLIGVLANYGFTLIMATVSQDSLRSLRNQLFARMQKLPVRYFDTHQHGDIMSGWFWGGSVFKYLKRNYWLMIRNFLLRKRSTKSVNFWLKTEDRFSRRNRYWKRSLALTMRVMTVL